MTHHGNYYYYNDPPKPKKANGKKEKPRDAEAVADPDPVDPKAEENNSETEKQS